MQPHIAIGQLLLQGTSTGHLTPVTVQGILQLTSEYVRTAALTPEAQPRFSIGLLLESSKLDIKTRIHMHCRNNRWPTLHRIVQCLVLYTLDLHKSEQQKKCYKPLLCFLLEITDARRHPLLFTLWFLSLLSAHTFQGFTTQHFTFKMIKTFSLENTSILHKYMELNLTALL